MRFNFDQIIDRSQDDSDKWQAYEKDVLPMWIADMDFKAPVGIISALERAVTHGIFGYGQGRPPEVLAAIQARMQQKYNWQIDAESIVFLPGLVCGMNVCARALGLDEKGDAIAELGSILTTTPVYPPFLSTPKNQGFEGLVAPMTSQPDSLNSSVIHFSMDFDALENAAQPDTKAFMLCQPHNPSGRIFTSAELLRLQAIATRNEWVVISDEIHAELTLDQNQHVPYATLNDQAKNHTITLFAPSKTFNIAGLGASFAVIENAALRNRFKRAMQGLIPAPNYLAMAAMKAAFTECDDWLIALNQYLTENRDYAIAELSKIQGLKMTKPEASFLLWLDFRATKIGENPFQALLDHKIALNNGIMFGEAGRGFARLNFGCPRATLEAGIQRIKAALA